MFEHCSFFLFKTRKCCNQSQKVKTTKPLTRSQNAKTRSRKPKTSSLSYRRQRRTGHWSKNAVAERSFAVGGKKSPSIREIFENEKISDKKSKTKKKPPPDAFKVESSQPPTKQSRLDHSLGDLAGDLGLRQPICKYNPKDQDRIRRAYLQEGPYQPNNHEFP